MNRHMGNKLSHKHATTCSLICSWYPSHPGLRLPHQKGLGFPQIMCHIVQLYADLSDVFDISKASRCLCIGDKVILFTQLKPTLKFFRVNKEEETGLDSSTHRYVTRNPWYLGTCGELSHLHEANSYDAGLK